MDVARRRRLVAQPGGLTMSFVLHLVDITTDNVLIIDIKDWRQHQQFIKANSLELHSIAYNRRDNYSIAALHA